MRVHFLIATFTLTQHLFPYSLSLSLIYNFFKVALNLLFGHHHLLVVLVYRDLAHQWESNNAISTARINNNITTALFSIILNHRLYPTYSHNLFPQKAPIPICGEDKPSQQSPQPAKQGSWFIGFDSKQRSTDNSRTFIYHVDIGGKGHTKCCHPPSSILSQLNKGRKQPTNHSL